MTYAQAERAALCDVLEHAGPHAPTLCPPWSAHDLAAHLWVRETDPLALPGMIWEGLAPQTESRMERVKTRWPFRILVRKLREGPAQYSVYRLPGVDAAANTVEYFVHCEDLRRAGDEPWQPRPLAADFEDYLFERLRRFGKLLFRKAKFGIVLERPSATPGVAETIQVASGSAIVTIVGPPSELVLYAFGRREVAQVQLVGEPESTKRLAGVDLGL